MGGYAINFTVYTMAMVGLICFALFVYKKFAGGLGINKKSEFLGVEESINLAPRKNLYVIRAGNEKFLVASDVDRTTLISKLGENKYTKETKSLRVDKTMTDLPVIVDFPKKNSTMIQDMLQKINEI